MNFIQFTAHQNIFHKTAGKLRISFLASIFLFSFSQLSAKEDTASQLETIEKRLAALEQENAKLKERISELEKGGAQKSPNNYPDSSRRMKPRRKHSSTNFAANSRAVRIRPAGHWTNPNHGQRFANACQNIPSGPLRSPHPYETIG